VSWDAEDLDADRRASALSLRAFCRRAWERTGQGRWLDGRHVAIVCEELEAVTRGEVDRLVVNVPPGFGKSWLVSVLWPAWEWGPQRRPELSYVAWTYASHLARRDGERMQTLCASEWYRLAWPAVRASTSDAARYFRNARGGFRFSTTVGGQLTGEHGDRLVVDDPNAAGDTAHELADTEQKYRDKTGTRGEPGHARVLVAQRLAPRDLTGFLLEQGWRHVRLPMRAERTFSCPSPSPHACRVDESVAGTRWDRPRAEGELLWPERVPEAEVAAQEKILGPAGAATQLQQRPAPAGGAVYQVEWLAHEWARPVRLERFDWLWQSWDTAFKGSDGSDWVVGTVWGWHRAKAHLLDLVRARMGFVETCAAIKRLTARYPRAVTKLVEDAANGAAVCEALEDQVPGLELVRPQGGKLSRAQATTGLWAAGDVLLPPDDWRGPDGAGPAAAEWKPAYRYELLSFRGLDSDVDDQVDSTSQALLYVQDRVGWMRGFSEAAESP
jgi:predicted phage terminase large subunit-like protein